MEKPDFEKIAESYYPLENARKVLCHDNLGQLSRQGAFIGGADHVWSSHVEPLQKEVKAVSDLCDNLQGMVKMRDETLDAQRYVVRELREERNKLKSENERLASGLNKAIEDLANTVPMDTYKHLWNSFTSSQSEVSLLKEQNNRLDDQVNELIGEKHAANELQSEITRLKDWQESAIKVLNDWYKVSDWLSDNGKAGLGDQYTAKALETLISQQAEIDSLEEQLKAAEDRIPFNNPLKTD